MAAAQEAHDSLRERARRALLDNPDPGEFTAPAHAFTPAAAPANAGATGYMELIDVRLRAIRLVRELEPKRACFADMVRTLTQSLVDLPGDSVHYRAALEKLREAHAEWRDLEEALWGAQHEIRATQWLVDLLSEPEHSGSPGAREAAAGHE